MNPCMVPRPIIAGTEQSQSARSDRFRGAAMLDYSFGLKEEADAVNHAIEMVLSSGKVTADLKPRGRARDHGTGGAAPSAPLSKRKL